MVERKSKIAEVTNATTKQAAVFIVVYSWVIVRNIGKAINRAVYKLPWLFIVLSIVISTIVSIVFIGKARAERDSYNKKLVHSTQLLDSYKNTYGGGGRTSNGKLESKHIKKTCPFRNTDCRT